MAQQIRYPLRVLHVRLASGHRLDVLGVDYQQLKLLGVQHAVDGLPEDPGALHRQVGDLAGLQPDRKTFQVVGHAPRGPGLSAFGGNHTGHHRVLVQVQSATPLVDGLRRSSRQRMMRTSGCGSGMLRKRKLTYVLTLLRGDNPWCSRCRDPSNSRARGTKA